jgi:hypothetical protein
MRQGKRTGFGFTKQANVVEQQEVRQPAKRRAALLGASATAPQEGTARAGDERSGQDGGRHTEDSESATALL